MDTEVHTIRHARYNSMDDTTTLDLYDMVEYTHLGVVAMVDGQELDMRTEVRGLCTYAGGLVLSGSYVF